MVRTHAGQDPGPGSHIRPRRRRPAPRRLAPADRLVIIGGSAGGPTALLELVPHLPPDIPAAIIIVQHVPAGYSTPLAQRLAEVAQVEVREARDGDELLTGRVLVAPADQHLTFTPAGQVRLTRRAPVKGFRPSIDVTMQSAAAVYGKQVIGIVLSGRGDDGASGAAAIRAAGGWVCAQSTDTSHDPTLPGRVIAAGQADSVIPLGRMAGEITRLCRETPGGPQTTPAGRGEKGAQHP